MPERYLGPRVSIVGDHETIPMVGPEAHHAWESSPRWGQNVNFALNFPLGTAPAGVLVPRFGSLQAIQKWEFNDSVPYTCTLNFGIQITPDTSGATNTAVRVIARIDFGSGAGISSIFVDWRQGTSITLAGTAVSVWAIFLPLGPGPADPSRVQLESNLTRGTSKSFASPTFTAIVPGGAGAFDRFITVPPFAKNLNIFQMDAPTPNELYVATNTIDFMTDSIVEADPPAALTGQSLLAVDGTDFEFPPLISEQGGITMPSLARTILFHGEDISTDLIFVFGLGL